MDLPKHTEQQRSESASYAILLYKLRNLGIFRNQTSSDYGIDFELELVNNGQVTGRYVKVQVKSAESVKVRADGVPTVGGIKQTTLNYWCELGLHTNVIAYAVDLTTEDLYISKDLLVQARELIDGKLGSDGKPTSKTIEFHRKIPSAALEDVARQTFRYALAPTMPDLLYAHVTALRRLQSFLEIHVDAFHYDPQTPVDAEAYEAFFESCRLLLWQTPVKEQFDEEDRKGCLFYEYWKRKSEKQGFDGLSCLIAQTPLTRLMPALIDQLRALREQTLTAGYYWKHRRPGYLERVYNTVLPADSAAATIEDWGYHFADRARDPDRHFSMFLSELEKSGS